MVETDNISLHRDADEIKHCCSKADVTKKLATLRGWKDDKE